MCDDLYDFSWDIDDDHIAETILKNGDKVILEASRDDDGDRCWYSYDLYVNRKLEKSYRDRNRAIGVFNKVKEFNSFVEYKVYEKMMK